MMRRFSFGRLRTAVFASSLMTTLAATCFVAKADPKPPAPENPMPPTREQVAVSDGFARALFANVAGAQGNVVVSPTSVESCVLMALVGARGQTADQIAQVLHVAGDQLADPGRLLDRSLALADRPPHTKNPTADLVIANSAWIQQGFPIRDAYRQLLQASARASFEQLDFSKTAEAAGAINGWVDTKTRHKIRELISPSALDSSTRMVLANAIYFKGQWSKPFDKKATKNQPFHRPGAADVSVPLMHHDSRFRYAETDRYQVVELPYTQEGISMIVWLPRRPEDMAEMQREIAAANFSQSLAKLASTSVDLFLPKFKIDANISLGATLGALGMKDAFTPSADFSGITDEPLWISAVVHQALVEVDEEGTEAAAATGIVAVTSAALPGRVDKKVFRADHPFVFAIRHRTTNDVLFVGRVVKP